MSYQLQQQRNFIASFKQADQKILCEKLFKITELDDSFQWEDVVAMLAAFIALHKIDFTIAAEVFFHRLNAMDCTRLEKFCEICDNSLDFTKAIL